MRQVIQAFRNHLHDFVECISDQIIVDNVPIYAHLPKHHVQEALFQAMRSLGDDLTQGTAASYAEYWRQVAFQRAEQGVLPSHSMHVTYLSSEVMTALLKPEFIDQPQALVWWLERMHAVISLGMQAMTETRLAALKHLGLLLDHPAGDLKPLPVLKPRSAWVAGVPLALPTLFIHTLGDFSVRRGATTIDGWGRRSAPLLLALLSTHAESWLQREQICEIFWPDLDPAAAESRFKVSLNALLSALEPDRSPRQPSVYIRRNGTAYRLAVDTPYVQVDHLHFVSLLQQADQTHDSALRLQRYRRVLQQYAEYLPNCLYADWTSAVREYVRTRYVEGCCTLIELLLSTGQASEAIEWAETVLHCDSCWEPAYQLLMRAWADEHHQVQVQRTYERCSTVLQQEFGLAPLPETTALLEELMTVMV